MREKGGNGIIKVSYLSIKEMPADGLTKLFNSVSFRIFQELIKITNQV